LSELQLLFHHVSPDLSNEFRGLVGTRISESNGWARPMRPRPRARPTQSDKRPDDGLPGVPAAEVLWDKRIARHNRHTKLNFGLADLGSHDAVHELQTGLHPPRGWWQWRHASCATPGEAWQNPVARWVQRRCRASASPSICPGRGPCVRNRQELAQVGPPRLLGLRRPVIVQSCLATCKTKYSLERPARSALSGGSTYSATRVGDADPQVQAHVLQLCAQCPDRVKHMVE
jgi:hypothetical protein